MHKFTKTFLHLWISLVSVAAFALGWLFFAHAEKPAPLVVPQVQNYSPGQTLLEPIPTINDLLKNEIPPATMLQNPSVSFPRLRTRGS
ncbi:MAG: hypothetical protein WA997_10825 [Anaerolineales bacterium]